MACLVPQACRPLSKPPRRGSTGLDGVGGGGGQPNGGWWTHDWAKVGWWGNQNVSTPGAGNDLDGTLDDPELPSNRTRNRTRSSSLAVKKTSFSWWVGGWGHGEGEKGRVRGRMGEGGRVGGLGVNGREGEREKKWGSVAGSTRESTPPHPDQHNHNVITLYHQ